MSHSNSSHNVQPLRRAMRQRPLFPLGQIVATRGALGHLDCHGVNAAPLLARHVHGDWGLVPIEDAQANRFAVDNGLRILSAYEVAGERIWIITEADRSATTLLLPEEY
ncbi:hypothetical protein [Cupriavidus sp. 8B]